MKILLIEDNENISSSLEYAFAQNSYDLVWASNIEEAKKILSETKINFIVLDVMLPDGNGFDFYENNLKKLKIPTILLTAIDDEENVVKGLNLGVDDYMTKPFSTKELLARINKIVTKNKQNLIIEVGNIKYDIDKMIIYKNNEQIPLTNLETRILHLLFTNINKTVSRNSLLEHIWEWTGNDVDNHTVTVYLKRIREKIDEDIIITVKGLGYRIDEDGKK